MAFGDGLETNVRQRYEKVAELYEPGDRVFLFGFSRGAFTARALAGLMWRYGIPSESIRGPAGALFDESWPTFVHEFPDERGEQAAKARRMFEERGQRECPVRESDAASSRVSEADRHLIAQPNTREVWFSGCHADVGGGAHQNGEIDQTAAPVPRFQAPPSLTGVEAGQALREAPRLGGVIP